MPDKDAKSKRAAPISYRPPQDRAAEFHARIDASGLSTNAFITEAIFGRSRHRPAEQQMLARLLDHSARIGDQLHELSLESTGNQPALDAVQHELAELRAALFEIMGRRP